MKAVAKKSVLSGHITVPGSKSHTIRALILAAMADGTSHVSNPLPSNDCLSTAAAVKKVGAEVDFGDGQGSDAAGNTEAGLCSQLRGGRGDSGFLPALRTRGRNGPAAETPGTARLP